MISEYSEPMFTPTALFGLEPIGVGTPFVESLSSYVARLAAAHMLSVSALLKHMVAYYLSDSKHNLGNTIGKQGIIKKMNGMGREASSIVDTLEKLTGRTTLRYLTMIPFSRMFSPQDLVNSHSAWCPYCLNQQRESGQTVYVPLLWCINMFDMCEIHQTPLQVACQYCRAKAPILGSRTVIGYCDKCNKWLGKDHGKGNLCGSGENESLLFRLLAGGKDFDTREGQSTLPSMLKYLISHKMKIHENVALAQILRCSESTIRCWLNGEALPPLKIILKIAELFGLDPMDVLTMSGEDLSRKDREVVASINISDDILYSTDWHSVHALLIDVANGKASVMSVDDIAKVYRCSPDLISERYPELCCRIEERFSHLASNNHSANFNKLDERIDGIIAHFLEAGVVPTKNRIYDLVGPKENWISTLVIAKYAVLSGAR